MVATLFHAKGLSTRLTLPPLIEYRKGPCSYMNPSKLEQPGPPFSHKLRHNMPQQYSCLSVNASAICCARYIASQCAGGWWCNHLLNHAGHLCL